MTNIEMNNEIVLLRHIVRQARVCVVNRLTKELKLLQKKHGNETQQEKYKRKANKLVSEIHVLKTIKDDSISKYGVMNERSLTEILQDQSLSDSDHVMARIVHYKTLCNKIKQFKEKFPNCKNYLTELGRRPEKLKSKTKTVSKKSNLHKQDRNIKKRKVSIDETGENLQNSFEDDEGSSELPEVKDVSRKRKKLLDAAVESKKLRKMEEDNTSADEIMDGQPTKLCSVTKEATIKRFTEFLGERESSDNTQTSVEDGNSTGTTVTQESVVDDFFFTGNNQGHYISLSTKSLEPNAQTGAFPSNNRFTEQNTRYKNDTRLSKSQRYNEFNSKPNLKTWNKKDLGKKTFMSTEKRETDGINRGVSKNNLHDTEKNVNLHPSWLAKKKQQEMMKQGFQGKKIVFGDD